MFVYFDNVDVKINGTGVLAESVSIRSANSLSPIYSLGRKGVHQQAANGPVKNTFQISYYTKLDDDPSFVAVNTLKNNTNLTGYSGVSIEIGGLTGAYSYLTNYSLNVSPNELIKTNVSFDSFIPLSGFLRDKIESAVDLDTVSGQLGHGWTVHVVSGDSYLNSPVYGFNYEFNSNWEPTYILGHKYPLQVDFMSASERMTFDREEYFHINFTGSPSFGDSSDSFFYDLEIIGDWGSVADSVTETENWGLITAAVDDFGNFLFLFPTVDLFRYDFICEENPVPSMHLSLFGSRITSSDLDVRINNFARTTTEIKNYF